MASVSQHTGRFAVDLDEHGRHSRTLVLGELQQLVTDAAAGPAITHRLQLKTESRRVRAPGNQAARASTS